MHTVITLISLFGRRHDATHLLPVVVVGTFLYIMNNTRGSSGTLIVLYFSFDH